MITIDFITDLPISNGYDSIMVMIDHGSTKGIILEPCHKTIDALGTAEIILNSLYKRYGLPDKAISDRRPQFTSRVFKELGKLLLGNQISDVYGSPPSNRWSFRKSKSRN